jgi:hypothetical protein
MPELEVTIATDYIVPGTGTISLITIPFGRCCEHSWECTYASEVSTAETLSVLLLSADRMLINITYLGQLGYITYPH